MNRFSLTFDRPEYLSLLALLPLLWWWTRRTFNGLSAGRRRIAFLLRAVVLALLVAALAEVQVARITDRVATFFLLDQSLSLTEEQRQHELSFVEASVNAHRDATRGDLAGVIVFGSDAQVEQPLAEHAPPRLPLASRLDRSQSNLAGALRLARDVIPDEMARRIVVMSDGNETVGDALLEGRRVSSTGIGIDVVPLRPLVDSDVLVEHLSAPAELRHGAPFEVTIALRNFHAVEAEAQPISGRLTVTRASNGQRQLVADQAVTLPPGKSVLSFRQTLDEAAFVTYEARFTPDRVEQDRFQQNNLATSFTQVRGQARVLFIVNSETPDEYAPLAARLRASQIEVVERSTAFPLFSSLAELQEFDTVVLANVPRVGRTDSDSWAIFSDEQVRMLAQYVEHFGGGLVMLGGPESFGPGDWANTPLEAAMPVDFHVRNFQAEAVTALLLVIDKSGSMNGEKLEMSKAAARAAVKELSTVDYVGVIAFDSEAEEVVKLQKIGDHRQRILSQIARIGSGGGTDMRPAVDRGYAALRRSKASVKHMILLTDGMTAGTGFGPLAARNAGEGITTTSVAVGADAARDLLKEISSRGQGKYYQVLNPRALPRLFAHETRRVARPLIYENSAGLRPLVAHSHEALGGIEGPLPPITGFVLTTVKSSPLVEVPVTVSTPTDPNQALVTLWQFGLGRTAVVSTDGGQRWAKSWTDWEHYDAFFVQLLRWSMRPTSDDGNFMVAADWRDGVLRAVVTGFDSKGDFLNGLTLRGLIAANDGASPPLDVEFRQVAPGRYVAEMPWEKSGSYLLSVGTGGGRRPLPVGVNVPYSREFAAMDTNEALLKSLAALTPVGGSPGAVARLPENPQNWRHSTDIDFFRRDLRPASSLADIWPSMLLAAAVVFLADIVHRRIWLTWPAWIASRFAGAAQSELAAPDESRRRLRQVKRDALEERGAASPTRDQPPPGEFAFHFEQTTQQLASSENHRDQASASGPEFNADDSSADRGNYSSRLLKLKRELRARIDDGKPSNEEGR